MKKALRKWKNDFKNPSSYETWYDIFEDWDLIESSFAQQYNIRLRKEMSSMDWGEFISYLTGLNGDTPLGNIIRIRSEKNPETLKNFTSEERKIRSKWINKNAVNVNQQDYKQAMDNFKNMFLSMSKGVK